MTDLLPPFPDAKAALRVASRAVRRAAFRPDGGALLAALGTRLAVDRAACVAGYWPMGGEIDSLPLMEFLAGCGCRLALPVVTGPDRPLEFRRWEPGGALHKGPHGTRHPPDGAAPCRPDLVLVPLLAFDGRLYRLGYGGGYYDRTLASLRGRGAAVRAIGLAYAAQRVASVPHDDYDQRLDGVLTETDLILPEE
jgi:5-formyltetrahydrofolate cyclo-ligase